MENLSYANVELLDPARSLVVAVISSRMAAKGMGEEAVAPAEAAAPAEEAAK